MKRKSFVVDIKPEVLKFWRKQSGLNIKEVARRLKTSPEKIRRAEKGKDKLTLKQAQKLSEIYHVSTAALLSNTIPSRPVILAYRFLDEDL